MSVMFLGTMAGAKRVFVRAQAMCLGWKDGLYLGDGLDIGQWQYTAHEGLRC